MKLSRRNSWRNHDVFAVLIIAIILRFIIGSLTDRE